MSITLVNQNRSRILKGTLLTWRKESHALRSVPYWVDFAQSKQEFEQVEIWW